MPARAQLKIVRSPGESRDGEWRVWVSAKLSETGKKYRTYHATKAAAEQFCREARARNAEHSDAARLLSGEDRLEAYRCLLKCREHGFTLTAATDAYVERSVQSKRSISLPALLAEYLAYKQGRGLSHDYLKDASGLLRRFVEAYPTKLASELSRDNVIAYLDKLAAPRPAVAFKRNPTGIKSPVSWNNHRRLISVFLNYAVRHDPPYAKANVCATIEEKPVPPKEVAIYTTDEAERLLAGAADDLSVLRPVLAIGLFAGVRPDECRRLDWSEVLWPEREGEGGHIEVKAAKSKDGKRRLVEMQPNLLAWLLPSRGTEGRIWPLGRHAYYKYLPLLRARVGVRLVDDGFRHSFASHHLAKFNDLGRTTGDLGHRTTAMLFEHYRSAVKRTEGVAYFNLYPDRNALSPSTP